MKTNTVIQIWFLLAYIQCPFVLDACGRPENDSSQPGFSETSQSQAACEASCESSSSCNYYTTGSGKCQKYSAYNNGIAGGSCGDYNTYKKQDPCMPPISKPNFPTSQSVKLDTTEKGRLGQLNSQWTGHQASCNPISLQIISSDGVTLGTDSSGYYVIPPDYTTVQTYQYTLWLSGVDFQGFSNLVNLGTFSLNVICPNNVAIQESHPFSVSYPMAAGTQTYSISVTTADPRCVIKSYKMTSSVGAPSPPTQNSCPTPNTSSNCKSVIVSINKVTIYTVIYQVVMDGGKVHNIIVIFNVVCSPNVVINPPALLYTMPVEFDQDTGIMDFQINSFTTSDSSCPIISYEMKFDKSLITQPDCATPSDTAGCRSIKIDTIWPAFGSFEPYFEIQAKGGSILDSDKIPIVINGCESNSYEPSQVQNLPTDFFVGQPGSIGLYILDEFKNAAPTNLCEIWSYQLIIETTEYEQEMKQQAHLCSNDEDCRSVSFDLSKEREYKFKFEIVSNAQPNFNIFQTQILIQNVTCGAEIQSVSNSSQIVVYDKDSGTYKIPFLELFSTSIQECHIDDFKLFDQDQNELKMNEIEIKDQEEIQIKTNNGFRKKIFLYSFVRGKRSIEKLEIDVTVCGQEQIIPLSDKSQVYIQEVEENGSPIKIDQIQIEKLLEYQFQPSQSSSDCDTTDISLYHDPELTLYSNNPIIQLDKNPFQITIQTNKVQQKTKIYLGKKTRGKVQGYVVFDIEIKEKKLNGKFDIEILRNKTQSLPPVNWAKIAISPNKTELIFDEDSGTNNLDQLIDKCNTHKPNQLGRDNSFYQVLDDSLNGIDMNLNKMNTWDDNDCKNLTMIESKETYEDDSNPYVLQIYIVQGEKPDDFRLELNLRFQAIGKIDLYVKRTAILKQLSMVYRDIFTHEPINQIENQLLSLDSDSKSKQAQLVGLVNTKVGYMLPNYDRALFYKALINNNLGRNNKRAALTCSYMNLRGEFTLQFNTSMMLPKIIFDPMWDYLLEVQIISDDNYHISKGYFDQNYTLDPINYTVQFVPKVISHSKTNITIQLEFQNENEFRLSGQALYRVKVKHPNLFKTLESLTPLQEINTFDGQEYFESEIPAINTNQTQIDNAKELTATVQETTVSFMFFTFLINWIMVYAMQSIWGAIRTLQLIFILVAIKFTKIDIMTVFLEGMSNFAQMDAYKPLEDWINENVLHLMETQPYNPQFELFGSDGMLLLLNIGSYFIFQISIISIYIFSNIMNYIAIRNYQKQKYRKMGFLFYKSSRYERFFFRSQKLFIETYFDICIGSLLNIIDMLEKDDALFYQDYGTIINQVILYFYCVLLPTFAIYQNVKIIKAYKKGFNNPKDKQNLQNFMEQVSPRTAFTSMFNIFYIYRRFITCYVLVFWTKYPSIQVITHVGLTATTVFYVVKIRPLQRKKDNQNETLNEVCVVLCNYSVMTLMLSNNVKLHQIMTYWFISVVCFNILYFVGISIYQYIQIAIYRYHARKIPKTVLDWLREQDWSYERQWIMDNGLNLNQFPQEDDFQWELARVKNNLNANVITKLLNWRLRVDPTLPKGPYAAKRQTVQEFNLEMLKELKIEESNTKDQVEMKPPQPKLPPLLKNIQNNMIKNFAQLDALLPDQN